MSCWHCAKALCPIKAVARGTLIPRIPAEWKHPVGKPTREGDATHVSDGFDRGEAYLYKSFTSLKSIRGHGIPTCKAAGVFCEHTYLFEGATRVWLLGTRTLALPLW